MRLLLTHGYFIAEDEKEQNIVKPYAPLGILYLSSHLRRQGFEVEIYDSTFGSKDELFRVLSDGVPGALGLYANLMTRGNAVEIARRARDCGWTVIIGGPEPANYPEQYLLHGADVVVAGEGELALEALLRTNCKPEHWPEIHGLYFRTPDGKVVHTSPGPLIPNLDDQPWPDRERIESREVFGCMADATRQRLSLSHHCQGLSLSLQLVQPCRLWSDAPAPVTETRRRRGCLDTRSLHSRNAVAGG